MSTAILAIDGPAGSGKSTVSRAVAQRLDWSYLDTGAMYRALTAWCVQKGVDLGDEDAVAALAESATITPTVPVHINGLDVSHHIRSSDVNAAVSLVAAQPRVRSAMVQRQREWSANQPGGVVVEGRDITTVVFPDATLKVYLTASANERSRRRGDEAALSIEQRDRLDSTRASSPLRQAPDALYIDTTGRSVDEVVEEIVSCLHQKI